MRFVIIGASQLGIATANLLLERGHEVVVIDQDEDKIESLDGELDCGMICADGSRPAVLKDVSPENTDLLLCLSDSDQDNIIATLVGRSLDFDRIVTQIKDQDFQEVCGELRIENLIVPSQEVGRALADMAEGTEIMGLTTAIKGDLRFFVIPIDRDRTGAIGNLDLPDEVRLVAVTRQDESRLVDETFELQEEDQLLLIGDKKHGKVFSALAQKETKD